MESELVGRWQNSPLTPGGTFDYARMLAGGPVSRKRQCGSTPGVFITRNTVLWSKITVKGGRMPDLTAQRFEKELSLALGLTGGSLAAARFGTADAGVLP